MTFSGERSGWKAPMDKIPSDEEWDLEEKNRHLEDENGLRALDQEVQGDEIERLKQQVEGLEIDGLTGAHRREIFKNKLARTFSLVRNKEMEQREGVESPQKVSLIFLDLDKFKQVNDTHGHQAGDEVLIRVAGLLKDSLRETDTLARYGGDEFIALLPNTNEASTVLVAEKLRASIEKDSLLKSFGVTASIGVCSSEVSTAEDSETFIKHTDEAAYFAKREGGNRVEVYK